MKKQSILYVNYSPYENAGKILDYFLENFSLVFLISWGFYYLGENQKSNCLTIYRNGKALGTYPLYQLSIPPQLVFLFLPIRSLINLAQMIFWAVMLYRQYGQIRYYFSVNAFTAWIGNTLRSAGLVRETIFWVWDYYPPVHENKIIAFMRAIYWEFDKLAIRSNRVAFVNKRLMDLRKDIGVLPVNGKYAVVPIGTDNLAISIRKRKPSLVFGFIGVIKKSYGLGIVFDNAREIIKEFPDTRYHVIGSGPDEEYFRKRAASSPIRTYFHHYMKGDSFNAVLKDCTVGIATYVLDASNVSHYGDPGKIKRYLCLGIPVITTDVIEFASDIKRAGAGEIIVYNNKKEFMAAVRRIISNYAAYRKNALILSDTFYYKNIYPRFFR